MDITILRIAFIWLVLGGVIKFSVAFFHSKHRGNPRQENDLVCGFWASVAFSQVLYGALGSILIVHTPSEVRQPAFLLLSSFAVLGWLSIDLLFLGNLRNDLTAFMFCLFLAASELVSP